MTPSKGFVNLAIGIIVAIALALGGGYYVYQKTGGDLNFDLPPILSPEADKTPEDSPMGAIGESSGGNQQPVACTADAKICPDGSAVGRVGPDCEFAACPALILTQKQARELVINKWGGCSPDQCSTVIVEVKQINGKWQIIATYDGLRDDSTKASRFTVEAVYSNNNWQLGNFVKTQSCQLGRGHQDFSTEFCY